MTDSQNENRARVFVPCPDCRATVELERSGARVSCPACGQTIEPLPYQPNAAPSPRHLH